MKANKLVTSVFAATIGLCTLTAAERVVPPKSGDGQLPELKLQSLAESCQKMLALQIAVHDGTKSLNKMIDGNADKLPSANDKERSARLADKQKAIIAEATNAIDMLKAERAAPAVSEVLEELRADMKRVQTRLDMGDVSLATQAVENDIIDTLKELIRSLNTT